MSRFDNQEMLSRGLAHIARIGARTWLILGVVALGIVGLLAWAAIAVLSWLWAQVPVAAELGGRLTGEAATQIEQVAPGLKEQAEQWLPWLGAALPVVDASLPAEDVSGTDLGPVPRFPGLVRSHFAREGQTVEVGYVGRAAFGAVLAHYAQGFTAAGYAQEVIAATPEGERHRFQRDQELVELSLTRRSGDLLELRLKQSSP